MKYKFNITGLDCPNCAAKLSKMIADNGEISTAKINFLTERLTVESELSEDAVLDICAQAAKKFDKNVKVAK